MSLDTEARWGKLLNNEAQRQIGSNPSDELPTTGLLSKWTHTDDGKTQYRFRYMGEGVEPIIWTNYYSQQFEDYFNLELHTRLAHQDANSFYRFCLTIGGAFVDLSCDPPREDKTMFGFLTSAILPHALYEI